MSSVINNVSRVTCHQYHITGKLQGVLHKITNNQDGSSEQVCYMCCAQLWKAPRLTERDQCSEGIMTEELIEQGIPPTYIAVRSLNREICGGYCNTAVSVSPVQPAQVSVEVKVERIKLEDEDEHADDDILKRNVLILGSKPNKNPEQNINKLNNERQSVLKVVVVRLPQDTLQEYIKKNQIRDAAFKDVIQEDTHDDVKTKYSLRELSILVERMPAVVETSEKKEILYFCNVCAKCFTCKNELMTHSKEHAQTVFTYKIKLRKNASAHSDLIHCGFCDYRYVCIKSLKNHLLKRHRKEFYCHVCFRRFISEAALLDHRFTHTSLSELYICDFCGKKFLRKDTLKQHMLYHTGPKYECGTCGKTFVNQATYKYHVKAHIERSYICDICGKNFAHKCILKSHIKTHTKLNLKCEVCAKLFAQASGLRNHMKTHVRDRRKFACHDCGAKFYSKTGLEGHVMSHTGVKPFECRECRKRFKTLSSLKSHSISHVVVTERKYVCAVCNHDFTHQRYLDMHQRTHLAGIPCTVCYKIIKTHSMKVHMRTHTGEKPYSCNICNKTFRQTSQVNAHMSLHTKQKPFQCDLCDKKFKEKRSLDCHRARHEQNKTIFVCNECCRVFVNKDKLTSHIKRHVKGKISCYICNKQFSAMRDVRHHMKQHKTYPCSFCRQPFSTTLSCNRHSLSKHGAKNYACNICEIMFQDIKLLYHHMRSHTGEKLYECETCHETFDRRYEWLRHVTTHT